MDQRNAGGQSRAPITTQDGWDSLHRRPRRAPRPPADRSLPSLRPVHRRLVHPEPDQDRSPSACRAPCWRSRSAASGAMAPGRPARFNAWAESLKDHPEATQPVLDAFCRNLYAPGFVYCVDRDFVKTVRDTVLGAGGQRRGASLPDLRGALEADPELRVHRGVEDGRGADLGQSPRRGVPGKAHVGPRVSSALSPTRADRGFTDRSSAGPVA